MKKSLSLCIACIMLLQMCIALSSEPLKIAEGTPIKLELTRSLTSGKVKTGEAVTYRTREDIIINGEVVIAKGAKGLGKVTVSKRRGMLGKKGKLEFTVESVTAINGVPVPLRTSIENSGKSNSGAVIASALLLTVFAVFISGRDITIKEGTEIVAYVDTDTLIDVKSNSKNTTTSSNGDNVNTPNAKFTLTSSFTADKKIIGEIQNDGLESANAEVIILIRSNDKVVGAGSCIVEQVKPGEKRSFNAPIDGITDGTADIKINVMSNKSSSSANTASNETSNTDNSSTPSEIKTTEGN
ncbi:MAG: hypothetical protein ACYC0V_21905 [Armatimonadota bacterium]